MTTHNDQDNGDKSFKAGLDHNLFNWIPATTTHLPQTRKLRRTQ